MSSDLHGEGLNKKDANVEVVFDVNKLKLAGNEFDDFIVAGNFENQRLVASTNVNSDLIDIDVNALLDVVSDKPSLDMMVKVDDADLYKLGILDYDKNSKLTTTVSANLNGLELDAMSGSVSLDNTEYVDSRGSYFMDSLPYISTL